MVWFLPVGNGKSLERFVVVDVTSFQTFTFGSTVEVEVESFNTLT